VNYGEIIEEVTWKLKNESAEILAKVPEFINDAIAEIADDITLPALKKYGTATTVSGVAWTTMPSGNSNRLLYAATADQELSIYRGGLDDLLRQYISLENEGALEAVTLEVGALYYQNIPSESETISVLYMIDPTELVSEADIPTCIPLALHRMTIVPKTLMIAFGVLESKMENKPNTDRNEAEYQMGKNMVLSWAAKRYSNKTKTIWDV
jgi:hypothetical protein